MVGVRTDSEFPLGRVQYFLVMDYQILDRYILGNTDNALELAVIIKDHRTGKEHPYFAAVSALEGGLDITGKTSIY